MHLRCPHCQNPIELADVPAIGEITCTSCGSTFQLAGPSTVTWDGPTKKRIAKFEILNTIGHGAFGTVLKASDTELDRIVAIKVPREGNVGSGPQDVDRFLREARAVAQLRFPSIISIYEVGIHEGQPYLVCDFVDGITLGDHISGRRFSFSESAKLIAEVADAIAYAHSLGVVHRDIKPSNIMIRPDGSPCVMDFGLAKRDAGEITMTIDGQILGTPAYMSPEQARGEGHKVDGRSDVYSLGVILYQLLTGELPFRGNKAMLLHQVLNDEPVSPRSLNDKIPRDLETIALKAMAKEPGRRYGSAKEMGDDLRRWLAGEPITARPVGTVERTWRWCKRNPALAAISTALAAVVIISFAVGAWQLNQTTSALALATKREQERDEADSARKSAQKSRTLAQIKNLLEVAPAAVPTILKELEVNRDTVLPRLRELRANEKDRLKRMRVAIALLPVEPETVRDDLATWLLEADDPAEVLLLRDVLVPYAPALPEALRACILTELLQDRDGKRFAVFLPFLVSAKEQFLPGLLSELNKPLAQASAATPPDDLANRQANAALALLRLNQPERVWPLCKHSPDPTVASLLTDRLAARGVELQLVLKRLEEETDESTRRVLVLSLAEFSANAWPAGAKTDAVKKLQALYRDAHDPGIHAASEWLLRQWHEDGWVRQQNEAWRNDADQRAKRLKEISQSLAKDQEKAGRAWYVNGQGQTLVVIPGPVEFLMGSPASEKGRFDTEIQHSKRIPRHFALAAKPVTVAEYRRFNPDFRFPPRNAPKPDCPIIYVTWHQAAAYCNWLSAQEGNQDQQCYEVDKNGLVVKLKDNYLSLTGYRLPTEAEWEYACRAKTETSRYFGNAEELLDRYAWYSLNSNERTSPVGSKRPNYFGIFDMHGNVWNWCQEGVQDYPAAKDRVVLDDKEYSVNIDEKAKRLLRGGSFLTKAMYVRSSLRNQDFPSYQDLDNGFRVSRTFR